MEFNSIEFFLFLFAVLVVINSLRRARYQQAVLLVGSYLFYWTTSNVFVVLLLFITVVSFQSGGAIHQAPAQARKKALLAAAVIALLIPLAYFKYYSFGADIVNHVPLPLNYSLNLPVMGLILPIGISFFTFSAISYVVDIYRGTIEPEPHFYRFALYVSYFPHLLAGPIVRAGQFLPQLINHVSLSPANLKTGVTIMLWGFVKKFVIADNCAPVVTAIFADPHGLSSPYIVIGTLLFGIQIYCDFSGYVDIALGTAELVGLHLPQNFFRPYLSKNPSEFWKRWNITLSSFIMDYIYISLGGNRKGRVRTYLNLEVAMLLSGLWHGAAWNFVLWGGYHGLLLSVHKFMAGRMGMLPGPLPSLNENVRVIGKILVTQYFIFLGWIMFRVGDLADMIYCIQKYVLFDFDFSTPSPTHIWGVSTIVGVVDGMGLSAGVLLLISIIIAILLLAYSDRVMDSVTRVLATDWTQYIASVRPGHWNAYVAIAVFCLLCFTPSASPVFIYYQF